MAGKKKGAPRGKMLEFGALNIKMPAPHSPERYVEMLNAAFALKNTVPLQGDWVALLGSVRVDEQDNDPLIVRGEFYKYIDLNAARDWFNVEKGKPAEKGDLDRINIPDELKPHFQFISFAFVARKHRLVLITKDGKDSMSSRQAAAVLSKLFKAPQLIALYGQIEVIVEPSRETLDAILGMDRLRSLIIEVTPPNPDDLEEYEKELFERMNAQRASSYRLELTEADNRGLAPDASIRALATVAQSNGHVTGVGGIRGKTKTVSTVDHPLSDKAIHIPEAETRGNLLLRKAREIVHHIAE